MEARVFVRPIASGLPLGLFVFGIGMVLLGAQSLGWIPLAQDKQVGLLLVTFVFPAEFLAGVIAFLARDTVASTVMTIYAGSWIALGLGLVALPPGTTHTLGFFLLAFAAVVYALSAVALVGKPLLTLILAVSATRALLQGIYEFSKGTSVDHAAGICALVLAALALYGGLAFLFEDVLGKRVLPTFRRGAAAGAIEGDLSEQLRVAAGDAGVRQQL